MLACKSTDRAHWSNGVDERSKCKHATIRQQWQCSDPMAWRQRQIDRALIQWRTGIVRLTALWSNGIQASSDWQYSSPMMLGIQRSGSHISGWPCHSCLQPCSNVVPVRVLIGAPSAGGALGRRLAHLCLETVLHRYNKSYDLCIFWEKQ